MAPVNNNSTKKRGSEEKVFHPDSRKAKQLERKQLRKSKLEDANSKKARKHSAEGMCPSFDEQGIATHIYSFS